jgi:hypothetical protein
MPHGQRGQRGEGEGEHTRGGSYVSVVPLQSCMIVTHNDAGHHKMGVGTVESLNLTQAHGGAWVAFLSRAARSKSDTHTRGDTLSPPPPIQLSNKS